MRRSRELKISEKINEIIKNKKPDFSRAKLQDEGIFKSRFEIIKDIGANILGLWPENVGMWVKVKTENLNRKEVQKYEGKETFIRHWKSVEKEEELQNIVIGIEGDPYGNSWYGTGPTRNPLRAFYTPIVLVFFENIVLAERKYGFRRLNQIKNLEKNIKKNLDLRKEETGYYGRKIYEGKIYVGQIFENEEAKYLLSVCLYNLSREKTGFMKSTYNGDLVLEIAGLTVSGHIFIPAHLRSGSPLFGSPYIELGIDGTNEVVDKINRWTRENYQNFEKMINKIATGELPIKTTYAVVVYGS